MACKDKRSSLLVLSVSDKEGNFYETDTWVETSLGVVTAVEDSSTEKLRKIVELK